MVSHTMKQKYQIGRLRWALGSLLLRDQSEFLNATSFLLGHVDVASRINTDAMGERELASISSRSAAEA